MGMNRTVAGVACGAGAGALWGLVFLAPELTRAFMPMQIAASRYLAYGVLALALLAPRWRRLAPHIGRAECWALIWLSLFGNVLYYMLLTNAVLLGGVAITSLIIGFLPVVVTLIGSRQHGAVPLGRLAPSLLLSAAGIACIGWQAAQGAESGMRAGGFLGMVFAAGALLSWTAFAVGNARWLGRLGHMSAHDWSLLTGVVTGAEALLLAIPAFLFDTTAHPAADWITFWAVAGSVAVFASIVGNALWNRASQLLPLTLVGQMILFETLFALLYAFLWEQRLPTGAEAAAMLLVGASVITCLRAHRVGTAAER